MAVPVLKLNLAPPSNLWRNNHVLLGWAALALGALVLAGSLGLTWEAYQEAARAGKLAVNLATKTRSTADAQTQVLTDLRSVDVAKELPRWRLAERIYTERSLPWSRLTSELERSMVEDVRVKSIQRNRSSDMKVQIKLKGEARTREAEAAFVEALQKNPFFEQVIMEREGERQGGGVEFDYTLAVSSTPPPYQPLPKYAPHKALVAGKAVPGQPNRIAVPNQPGQPNRTAPPYGLPAPLRTNPAIPPPPQGTIQPSDPRLAPGQNRPFGPAFNRPRPMPRPSSDNQAGNP
jgi:hypothetical protein